MDLDTIQAEQVEWSLRNFGVQPAHCPMLGIIEELCELEQALLIEEGDGEPEVQAAVVDAIGDVAIYMLDYCGKRGWRMQELWDERKALDGYEDFTFGPSEDGTPYVYQFILVLAHSQLKGEQNIRGGSDVHDVKLKGMLSNVLWLLQETAEKYYKLDALTILAEVWSKVKQRNWVANPNNAHVVVDTSAMAGNTDP